MMEDVISMLAQHYDGFYRRPDIFELADGSSMLLFIPSNVSEGDFKHLRSELDAVGWDLIEDYMVCTASEGQPLLSYTLKRN